MHSLLFLAVVSCYSCAGCEVSAAQGAHDRFQLGNRGYFWNTSQHDSDILLLLLKSYLQRRALLKTRLLLNYRLLM
jgi:Ni,Fe-hydrogenase III small subunit